MTKTNKKGFTLIELIIVIAILAILVAALAPALIKYIEKSRVKKDTSSLDNVYTTIKAALGDEDLYKTNTKGKLISLNDLSTSANTNTSGLKDELFGSASSIKGTLDADYAASPANNVFKSKTAEGASVYFVINDAGKVGVCLVKDNTILTDFGTNGFVGDATAAAADISTIATVFPAA